MMRAAFFMSMLSIATLTMGHLRGATELNSRIRMKERGKSESTLQRKEKLNNMFKSEWEDSRSRMGVRHLLFHFTTRSPPTVDQEKKKGKMRGRRKRPTPYMTKQIKKNPAPPPTRRKKMMMKQKKRTKRPTPSPQPLVKAPTPPPELPTTNPTPAIDPNVSPPTPPPALPTNNPTPTPMIDPNVIPPTPPPALPTSNPAPTPTFDPNVIVYGLQPSCNSVNDAGYNICLDLVSISGSRANWMDAFAKAKQRWESIIVGDLSNFTSVALPAGTELCTGFPSTIDDVYICGREDRIDGLGRILGWAGPTSGRYSRIINPRTQKRYLTTVTGRMKFDTADIAWLLANGGFENVVLHEMAHVLGVGTLWEMNGLYIKGSGIYASGTRADAEWKGIGCSGPLPVELDYGDGTRDGHWDEECLDSELTTGIGEYANVLQPISRITVGSLEDLGYVVDYSKADAFTIDNLGVCGSSCPEAGTRKLRTGEGKAQVKLSSNDIDYIMHFAKSELAPLQQEWKAAEIRQGDSDDEIVAFNEIIVLFQDKAGHLHDVPVSWDDVKDSDI